MAGSRKRSHDNIEDSDESLPISKRIHSLHIEGNTTNMQVNPADLQSSAALHSISLNHLSPELMPQSLESLPSYSLNPNSRPNRSTVLTPDIITPGASHDISYQGRIDCQMPSVANGISKALPHQYLQALPHTQHSEQSSHPSSYQHGTCQNGLMFDNLVPNHLHSSPTATASAHLSHGFIHRDTNEQLHVAATSNGQAPTQANIKQSHNAFSINSNHLEEQNLNHHLQHQHQLHNHHHQHQEFEQEASGSNFSVSSCNGVDTNFNQEQLPSGIYEPELDDSENPFYYSVNRMLYEAHVSRMRRMNQFPGD